MRRRHFLTLAGSGVVAGCLSGDSGESPQQSESDQTPTPETTTPPARDTEFNHWDDFPQTATVGKLVIDPREINMKQYLRYYDEDTDSLKEYHPDREWWAEVTIRVKNLGGETIVGPSLSEFKLVGFNQIYDLSDTIPGLDTFDMRQREKPPRFSTLPRNLEEPQVNPGSDYYLHGYADVNITGSSYILWKHDGKESKIQTDHLDNSLSVYEEFSEKYPGLA